MEERILDKTMFIDERFFGHRDFVPRSRFLISVNTLIEAKNLVFNLSIV